jgi:HK97 family phage prohead protease
LVSATTAGSKPEKQYKIFGLDSLALVYKQLEGEPSEGGPVADLQEPEPFVFSGYANTRHRDSYDDEVEPQGFLPWLKRFNDNPAVEYCHWDLIGHSEQHGPDELGFRIERGLLTPDLPLVLEEVWPLMRHGSLRAMSIGFYPKKWEWKPKGDTPNEGEYRIIHELELLEVSIVPVPANAWSLLDPVVAKSFGSLGTAMPNPWHQPAEYLQFLQYVRKEATAHPERKLWFVPDVGFLRGDPEAKAFYTRDQLLRMGEGGGGDEGATPEPPPMGEGEPPPQPAQFEGFELAARRVAQEIVRSLGDAGALNAPEHRTGWYSLGDDRPKQGTVLDNVAHLLALPLIEGWGEDLEDAAAHPEWHLFEDAAKSDGQRGRLLLCPVAEGPDGPALSWPRVATLMARCFRSHMALTFLSDEDRERVSLVLHRVYVGLERKAPEWDGYRDGRGPVQEVPLSEVTFREGERLHLEADRIEWLAGALRASCEFVGGRDRLSEHQQNAVGAALTSLRSAHEALRDHPAAAGATPDDQGAPEPEQEATTAGEGDPGNTSTTDEKALDEEALDEEALLEVARMNEMDPEQLRTIVRRLPPDQ